MLYPARKSVKDAPAVQDVRSMGWAGVSQTVAMRITRRRASTAGTGSIPPMAEAHSEGAAPHRPLQVRGRNGGVDGI